MPLDSAEKGATVRQAGFTIARVSFGVLAASLLAAATLAAPAAGPASASTCPPSGKCFAVTVSPASPTAGATTSFAFTITNEAATQQLGSAQISAPAGFVITGAPGAKSFTPSSALFINLGLNPPTTTTTLTVNAIPVCSGGSYQWGIEAKQSNDFSGTGNDFQLDPASAGNLSGSVAGSCSLAFTGDGQPAGAAVNAVITSGFPSPGGPVKVEVLDGSGKLVTGSTAAVTVAIGSNPGAGSLSGTLTVNASGGVASFSDLSIDQPGAALEPVQDLGIGPALHRTVLGLLIDGHNDRHGHDDLAHPGRGLSGVRSRRCRLQLCRDLPAGVGHGELQRPQPLRCRPVDRPVHGHAGH